MSDYFINTLEDFDGAGYNGEVNVIKKADKFSFDELKADATSDDPTTRKNMFKKYFERFEEFPSYLFDNTEGIDRLLLQTIRDIANDSSTSEQMQKGIVTLMERLPSPIDDMIPKAA